MSKTITEALAEIKTIGKRLERKREVVLGFLHRQDHIRDPLAKDGGSQAVIAAELQSIADLETRIILLRRGIATANEFEYVTIAGKSRSIAEWLTWRREIAPLHQQFLNRIRRDIDAARNASKRQGSSAITPGVQAGPPPDIIVNIDERLLANSIEALETTLGELDGVLSLKNATTQVAGVA